MNKSKKVIQTVSAGFTVLWFVLFAISVAAGILYTDPEAEPLEFFLSKGIYHVFILTALMGLISSGMLSLSLRVGKTVTILAAVMDNLLFYLSVGLVFRVRNDAVIIAPLMWCVCSAVCIVLLVIQLHKK